ncbi:MAG: UDP-glucose/GDP-mannose dehydrogenase family protein [Puniceicoccales bacterium]|jgi:UDPglucose 6-dehydrogenase|nr:UDP-glucose/GDP-mannose dehydrogenase family protein [Puniceicoccales bacterium]
MKVAIIGTGYVGLPTGVGFAALRHHVTCVDSDRGKISRLSNGDLPIFENGLEDIFMESLSAGKIEFTTSMEKGIAGADVVIITVGTPTDPTTHTIELKYVRQAADQLAKFLKKYAVIAVKSTVAVGTCDEVEQIIRQRNPHAEFDVISMPEFLREGFAVHDFFNPDRIVVGTDSMRAKNVIGKLYEPLEKKSRILYVGRRSGEMIKYASNAFLAIKIHYINEVANLCEKTGADIEEVALGIGMDSRIGDKFLKPGPGYGGSCFPKDTSAMVSMGRQNNTNLRLVEMAIAENSKRKDEMANRILDSLGGIDSPKVAILGLAFKGGTDDCRESPAIEIIEKLLGKGVKIVAFDPKAMANAKTLLGDNITYATDACAAAKEADLLVVATEWDEFGSLDLERIKASIGRPKIFDMRNVIDANLARKLGFSLYGIGKQWHGGGK